jgi:hypothetical protein
MEKHDNKIHKIVFWLSSISLLWIFLYKLYFMRQNSIFPKAQEIGEITFALLSSVIASSIFYFFVVYLEQKRISKIIDPIIHRRLKSFGVSVRLIKDDLYKLKKLPVPHKIPEREDFRIVCDDILLTQKAQEIRGNPSYTPNNRFEYFDYFFQSDRYISNLLYAQINYLSPELIAILDDIQYSDFQRALDTYKFNRRYNKLSGVSGPLWGYLKNLEKLANY